MNTLAKQLLLQVFLIFLNAFFAMTEIAVISLSPARLRRDAEKGDATAARLLRMVEQPAGFLSTIQIGITLAGFLGSAFAAESFSGSLSHWLYEGLGFTALPLHVLDTLSVVLITLILSYFTLIFGELVPKRLAMQKTMQAARFACMPVAAVAAVMRPVVWFLSASTNLVLRLLHLNTEAEEETVTEEEIRLMVDLGEEKGAIDAEEKEWIENVFDFGDAAVRDCMTRTADVRALPASAGDEAVLSLIRESGLSRFPVFGRDIHDILGVLSARDFLIDRSGSEPRPLSQLLRPAYFVPEGMNAADLFQDMQQNKVHLAIAVDEYGETAGLVTMEDLLEEIVGNIYDEFDPPEDAPVQQLDGERWRMSGDLPVEEVARVVGLPLQGAEGADTLGGLVYSCLRTIPQDGAAFSVETQGLHIQVESVQGRRVCRAVVQKCAPAPEKNGSQPQPPA